MRYIYYLSLDTDSPLQNILSLSSYVSLLLLGINMKVYVHSKELEGEVLKETKNYILIKCKGGKVVRIGKHSKDKRGSDHRLVK